MTFAVPPPPDRIRTGAPTREPETGATPNAQPVAPAVTKETFTDSRIPSPFGDRRPLVIDADRTVGATVSTVTPWSARLAAWNPNAGL